MRLCSTNHVPLARFMGVGGSGSVLMGVVIQGRPLLAYCLDREGVGASFPILAYTISIVKGRTEAIVNTEPTHTVVIRSGGRVLGGFQGVAGGRGRRTVRTFTRCTTRGIPATNGVQKSGRCEALLMGMLAEET